MQAFLLFCNGQTPGVTKVQSQCYGALDVWFISTVFYQDAPAGSEVGPDARRSSQSGRSDEVNIFLILFVKKNAKNVFNVIENKLMISSDTTSR